MVVSDDLQLNKGRAVARMNMSFLIVCIAAAASICSDSFAAEQIVASIVGSDDASMVEPAARDDSLTAAQIEQMVRLAVERVGGMDRYVPADADLVGLKPNLTIARPAGSGVITDNRVVRAVALLVHEVAPLAKIVISEATAGWLHPSLQDCSLVDIRGSIDITDGWEVAGYYPVLQELQSRGIDIEVHDLSFDPLDTLIVSGGGLADDEYILPQTITRADAWINIPVAKPHGAKMTACMKNRFGILPGAVYGWDRASGTARHEGIRHAPQIIDETFVDLLSLEAEDLCVCDMINNVEGGAFSGNPRRSNLIVAGSDPVGTDLVVARLMGFNPDDMEFADLAWQRGLGPRFIERVDVDGDVEALAQRFMKAGADYGGGAWTQHADYGMGPRRWLLWGPQPRDHQLSDEDRRRLLPRSGVEGWSEWVFFGDDRIDLDRYYEDPIHCAVYGYTTFTMAQSDSVRFWIGSDDAMTIWIDGNQIYTHEGRRNHRLGDERLPGYIEAGDHTLLIRVEQGRGRFDFSFNICEPIDDKRHAGNRYRGLRYFGESIGAAPVSSSLAAIDQFDGGWQQSSKYELTIGGVQEPMILAAEAPDSVLIAVEPARSGDFLDVVAAAAGSPPIIADSAASAAFHKAHAWFARMPSNHDWYPEDWPGIGRYFNWSRLDYGISFGFGRGEALLSIRGWLAQGHVAVVPHADDGIHWRLINGYRHHGEHGLQFHSVSADSMGWSNASDWGEFWGMLVNRSWAMCPVIIAAPATTPQSVSLVDEWAAALVQKATEETSREVDSGDWGRRAAPVGLAAWDDWVIEWERYPWSRKWAMQVEVRRRLSEIADLYNYIAENHRGSGDYLAWAAEQEIDESRASLLRTAAAGYLTVAGVVDTMGGLMPTETGDLDEQGEARMARIGELRSMPRRARRAARTALEALVTLIDADPLTPVQEDPLRHRSAGLRLMNFRAGVSKGIHHLTLQGVTTQIEWFHGRELNEVSQSIENALPAKTGWIVVVEPTEGLGMYSVTEQPSANNDWTARILIDDEWTPYSNSINLVLWAIPDDL